MRELGDRCGMAPDDQDRIGAGKQLWTEPTIAGCGQNEIAVGFLQDCDVRDWLEARKQQEMNVDVLP